MEPDGRGRSQTGTEHWKRREVLVRFGAEVCVNGAHRLHCKSDDDPEYESGIPPSLGPIMILSLIAHLTGIFFNYIDLQQT